MEGPPGCDGGLAAERWPRRVLDLGGGPGLFAERLAARWPDARITLVDIDPVLLAMARAVLPASVTVLDADLADPAWTVRAGAGYDLVTAVMTVHYLEPAAIRALYRAVRRLLVPGGLFVVADVMPDDGLPSLTRTFDPATGTAAAELEPARGSADRASGVPDDRESGVSADRREPGVSADRSTGPAVERAWVRWWAGLADVPGLDHLMRDREVLFQARPPADFTATSSWHRDAVLTAGFTEAGLLWRHGRHAALAAYA